MKIIVSIAFLYLFIGAFKSQNPEELLGQLVSKFERVQDYSAAVNIKADIPLIKILPVRAKIYFKKENQFKVVSKGIAILPKQGFTDMNVFLRATESYMVVFAGEKIINNVNSHLLTVIANESDSEIILIKLWVDPIKKLILESEITTRSSGNVKVSYTYNGHEDYGLPSELKFEVDVKEFKMPKSFSSNPHKTTTGKVNKRKSGIIHLILTDYKVNQGIEDSFFDK
tara:strand:- start:15451 stop:16131 length:681 start_codon:yes stop_codon:yes gene_type:complete